MSCKSSDRGNHLKDAFHTTDGKNKPLLPQLGLSYWACTKSLDGWNGMWLRSEGKAPARGREGELPKRFCSWPLDKVGKGDTTVVNLQHAIRQEKLDDINTHFIYQ